VARSRTSHLLSSSLRHRSAWCERGAPQTLPLCTLPGAPSAGEGFLALFLLHSLPLLLLPLQVVTDPAPILAAVDRARFDTLREWMSSVAPSPASCHGAPAPAAAPAPAFTISEPTPELVDPSAAAAAGGSEEDAAMSDPAVWAHLPQRVRGTVQRFGDMVDTGAWRGGEGVRARARLIVVFSPSLPPPCRCHHPRADDGLLPR
jgi:hypothetical protein